MESMGDRRARPGPGPQGRSGRSRQFCYEYLDRNGKRVYGTGTPSKSETQRIADSLELREKEIALGLRPAPKSSDKAAARSFSMTVAEYLEWGQLQGGLTGGPWGKTHLRMRRDHLQWWAKRLSLETLADLSGSLPKVEKALRELDAAGRSGKTLSNLAESLKAFCLWARDHGYLDENPLAKLRRFNTKPLTRRRAMTADEIARLLEACNPSRRLLYEVAFSTGLRAGELRGLKVADLDRDCPAIHVRAEVAKNRKPASQPLPVALWERFRAVAAGLDPDAALLRVTVHPARELDKDLKKAGILKWTPEGKIDFHAARVAFCTMLLESGADVKTCMSLARHHAPDLTLNVYGRTRLERLSATAEAVGSMIFSEPEKCSEPETSPKPKVVGMENQIESSVYKGGARVLAPAPRG